MKEFLGNLRVLLPKRAPKPSIIVGLVALLSSCPLDTTADIAPMEYHAYTLAPSSNTDIRMADETVDIRIGERVSADNYIRLAQVVAEFNMINESADTITLNVGFPVETFFLMRAEWRSLADSTVNELMANDAVKDYTERGIYDFEVSVNDDEPFAPGFIKTRGQLNNKFETDYLWFNWRTTFPPGSTQIRVTYHVPTNYSYGRGYQNLSYVLYSGSFWKDDIGHAVVRVQLPVDAKDAVLGWVTPGYRCEGNTIIWEYEDFEPGIRDNIRLEYLPFDAQKKIEELKELVDREKENSAARIELARLYLSMAARGPEVQNYPDLAALAEQLLEEALDIDPGNALAWNTYLTNYFRMHDKTFGLRWYMQFPLVGKQKTLIKKANEECPEDGGIQAWYALMTPSVWQPPDTLGYLGKGGERLNLHILGPRRNGYSRCELSPEGVSVIESCYETKYVKSPRRYLLVLKQDLSFEERRRVVEVLDKCRHYQSYYGDLIASYNRRSGIR